MKPQNASQLFGDTDVAQPRNDRRVRPAFVRSEMTILEQRTTSQTGCGKQ
jgi:hypothetical protein